MENIPSSTISPKAADPFPANPFSNTPIFTTSPIFAAKPFNPEKAREWIRGSVALLAIVAFTIVVVLYLHYAVSSGGSAAEASRWSQVKDAMQAIFPAVTSVLGTVLGFYFGSQKS